ncbi:hypothetical protein ACTA71_004265 [Dictyostelium dimigraforme]
MNYEETFWKVIKNKILFKIILKNINNNKNYSINYFSKSKEFPPMHSIEWLISNNKKSILEYKIINHHYLALGKSPIYGKFYRIFSFFSNEDNPVLYRSLIYMFPKYFEPSTKQLQDRINESIESNNLNVLKVMCDPNGQCKHQPTANDFILSLKNNKLIISSWIGETFPGIHYIFGVSQLRSTQLFEFLFQYIDDHHNEIDFNRFTLFQIISTLLNNCQFSHSIELINNIEMLKQYLFNICPIKNSWSIDNLFHSCQLILKFNSIIKNLKEESKSFYYKEDNENQKQKEEEEEEGKEKEEKDGLDGLLKINFSNYQKTLLLKNAMEFSNYSINIKIRKLLKIYLSSLDDSIVEALISNEPLYKSWYGFYNYGSSSSSSGDDNDNDGQDDNFHNQMKKSIHDYFHCNSHLEALKNGDFLLLKKWFTDQLKENPNEIPFVQLIRDINTTSTLTNEPISIFSNCNGNDEENKSKRLEFIKYLLFESNILQDHLLNPWLLFCLVLKFNDYPLIEMVFNNLSKELIKQKKSSTFSQYQNDYLNLGKLVKNENAMELLYPHFPFNDQIIIENKPYWDFKEWRKNGRVDLFEVFESFIPNEQRIVYSTSTLVTPKGSLFRNTAPFEIGFYGNELLCLLNALAKPNLYEISATKEILFKVDEETTIDDIGFIKLIISEMSNEYKYCFTDLKKGSFEIFGENFVQFLDWFFSNRQTDITSDKFIHSKKEIWLITMKYIAGGDHFNEYFTKLNSAQFFDNLTIKNSIFELVARFGDIHFIDKIIQHYFNGIFPLENNSITDAFNRLIQSTISNGHLKLLEYFNLNFKSTFFNSSLFKQIKLNIINNNQLEFNDYILNLN